MSTIAAPYVGIRPFEKNDWPIFFGREALSNQLLHKLAINRFVAVVGSSGSGKSSVVKAGLIPFIEEFSEYKLIADASDWITLTCRPGDDPCASLAKELVALERKLKGTPDSSSDVIARDLTRAELRKSTRGIVPFLERLPLPTTTHILLVIDQFEEVFGFRFGTGSEPNAQEEAERFVACVLGSCSAPVRPTSRNEPQHSQISEETRQGRNGEDGLPSLEMVSKAPELHRQPEAKPLEQRIWVAITMRSDFIGHCEIFPALAKRVSESQFLVPVLDPAEKREAILGPTLTHAADHHAVKCEGQTGTRSNNKPYRGWWQCHSEYDPFQFEEGLVNIIINESGSRIDQLPLMQHALMRTWTVAVKRTADEGLDTIELKEEDYKSIGRIDKALSKHADDAFNELTNNGTDKEKSMIVRRLFLLLCDVSPEGKITRRRPRVQEVMDVTGATLEQVEDVVRAFQNDSRNFIVTWPAQPFTNKTRLDVSHEALLRQWDKLNQNLQPDQDQVSGETAQPQNECKDRRIRQAIRDWVAFKQGKGASGDKNRRDYGWLFQEKDAAAELIRLSQEAELYEQGRGGLLNHIDLARVEEWRESNKPSLHWALRYLENKGKWKAIEKFEEASKRKLSKGKWAALSVAGLIASVLLITTTIALYHAQNLKVANGYLAELRLTSDKRRDSQLKLARSSPTSPALANVERIRYYANALRADRGSTEAIRFITDALAEKQWFRPLTANLSAPPGIPFLSASIAPDGNIYAIARDGRLMTNNENRTEFVDFQSVLPDKILLPVTLEETKQGKRFTKQLANLDPQLFNQEPKPPAAAPQPVPLNGPEAKQFKQPKQPTTALQSASFSEDGSHLIVFHQPNFGGWSQTFQVWKWSGKEYAPLGELQTVSDRASSRIVTWSANKKAFILSRWDVAACVLYRLENNNWDFTSEDGQNMFRQRRFQSASFSPDSKKIAAVPGDLTAERLQFFDVTAARISPLALRSSISVPSQSKVAQVLFGPEANELTLNLSPGAPHSVNLETDAPVPQFAVNKEDQILRIIFSPAPRPADMNAALIIGGRADIYSCKERGQRLGEPIRFRGMQGQASFSTDGKSLLTWSGPTWGIYDTVRLWSLEIVPPVTWNEDEIVQEKELAPLWLADLADAISGQGGSSDEEGIDSNLERKTLEGLVKKYEKAENDKFKPLWNRFTSHIKTNNAPDN